MRLVTPRDPLLLRALAFGRGENHTPNRVLWICQNYLDDLADVEDWKRESIGKALARLYNMELVERIPPDTSGLYRISKLGEAALVKYEKTGETEFNSIELMRMPEFDRDEFFEDKTEYQESGPLADMMND